MYGYATSNVLPELLVTSTKSDPGTFVLSHNSFYFFFFFFPVLNFIYIKIPNCLQSLRGVTDSTLDLGTSDPSSNPGSTALYFLTTLFCDFPSELNSGMNLSYFYNFLTYKSNILRIYWSIYFCDGTCADFTISCSWENKECIVRFHQNLPILTKNSRTPACFIRNQLFH